MEFVARSKVQGVFFATTCFLQRFFFCHGVIVLVGQATKEWETRSVWCDGVFFATVCFLRRCVFQRRSVCCTYMVVYFATGTGVVSFGGRVFFATLCFLRRSVGAFCVDQKCFLHSESVFFASQRVFCDREQGL